MNWGIKVLQTSALPLGYGAVLDNDESISYCFVNVNRFSKKIKFFFDDFKNRFKGDILVILLLFMPALIRILSENGCFFTENVVKKFIQINANVSLTICR